MSAENKRVLFVWTDITTTDNFLINFGIASVAGYLSSKGVTCDLIYLKSFPNEREFLDRVRSYNPDMVAFSVFTNQWHFVKRLAGVVKSEMSVPTIAGGIHATMAPQEIMDSKVFDAVCVGEGEYSVYEFLESRAGGKPDPLPAIANLWQMNGSGIVKGDLKPRIKDLDELPYYKVDIFDVNRFLAGCKHEMLWIVGRGCPMGCTYCNLPGINELYGFDKKGTLRRQSPRRVVDELLLALDRWPAIERFLFHDEIFTMFPTWLREFRDIYTKEIGLPFGCQTHVETMSDEVLQIVRDTGGDLLKIGVESGNEWLRREVLDRRMKNEDIIDAFYRAHKLGFQTLAYTMVGFPLETPEMFEDTLSLIRTIEPDEVMGFIYYPYPGTKLYDSAIQMGALSDEWASDTWEKTILHLDTYSKEEIKRDFHRLINLGLEIRARKHLEGHFDFAANMDSAVIVSDDHTTTGVGHFCATYERDCWIFIDGEGSVTWTIDIPENAVLSFDYGMAPETYEQCGDGQIYKVFVDDAELFGVEIDPRNTEADRGHHEVNLDLSDFAGENRRIEFRTEKPAGKDHFNLHGGFGRPRIEIASGTGGRGTGILPVNSASGPGGNLPVNSTDGTSVPHASPASAQILRPEKYHW
ncbi:MAG: cobalamin-dependent protein [Planctomycetes bacterium]|nr:cobalamin-dependent protein [Planctomycetota bacterium]